MENNSPRGDSNSRDDPFGRLPDEVLIMIFTKLPEFLSQCILVCRRFASTIDRGAPNLSITLPSLPLFWRVFCILEYQGLQHLRSQLKSSYAKTTNFLNKFESLRSLNVVFPYSDDGEEHRWFCSWKVKVETDCYTIAYLQSESIDRWVKEDANFATTQGLSLTMLNYWTEIILAHDLLVTIIQDYPMLESVTITITKNTRKICVSGDELVKLKTLTTTTMEGEWEKFFWGVRPNMKRGTISRLVLPVSGLVMENVVVHIQRICRGGKVPENEDDIIAWEYGEDEKVFEEAIKSVLMNHSDELRYANANVAQ